MRGQKSHVLAGDEKPVFMAEGIFMAEGQYHWSKCVRFEFQSLFLDMGQYYFLLVG